MTIAVADFLKMAIESGVEVRTAFDVGSLNGADAVLMADAFPKSTVYAFEADERAFSGFRVPGRFEWELFAAWNVAETRPFHQKDVLSGISSLRNRGDIYGGTVCQVGTGRLDQFCSDRSIASVEVVKIDVEGCSYEVLEGFGAVLSTVRWLHVETEVDEHFAGQHLQHEVFGLLERSGMVMAEHSHCTCGQWDSVWRRD